MADSEDEHDDQEGINLTSFLFGNVDESGRLESDILDSESQRHLASLGRLGLGSLLAEMVGNNTNDRNDNSESEDDSSNHITDNHVNHIGSNGDINSLQGNIINKLYFKT